MIIYDTSYTGKFVQIEAKEKNVEGAGEGWLATAWQSHVVSKRKVQVRGVVNFNITSLVETFLGSTSAELHGSLP